MQLSDILAQPVVDREQFEMLVETGEDAAAELIQELLDLFRDESAPRFEMLQESLEKQEAPAIAKHAHSLAGASANLGALRLAKLCRRLEAEAMDGHLEALEPLAGHMREQYQETLNVFEQEIVKLQA
ncbi:MAG: multi-sensor hybrid histidine kinase [Puniceicoccaceae bacterium 5H]|nr:MAG: multi-sensor hybrid histidine kinase [Puniceicoccaceae bacterium 5H]